MVSRMREESGLLTRHWYAGARSEEVTDRRPLGRTIFGELIVLWRGRDGRAVAMLDRCLHRNALLSAGDLFDGCIGCPYHGWTYDASGHCVNVPSEGPDGAPLRVAKRVETFPTREQDGLVWVWMDPAHPPDREPFSMPYRDAPGWDTYYMTTRFENGVTHLVENFMDVPHTVFVHRGWFRDRARRRVPTTVERTADAVLVTYDQPKDSIGFTERLLNPRGLPMVHTDRFYMPNTTRVDYVFGEAERAFVITSTCTPIGEHETMVYTLISYKLGPWNPLAGLVLPLYTRQVIQQDVDIMAIQGRALRHHGAPDFTSTPADTLHLHIEALRDWAARGGVDPRPEPVVERMEFWI
jgi:phenylpropionate dioxygenase-like ring-hydroxylating dioxygenase large terminal subunit